MTYRDAPQWATLDDLRPGDIMFGPISGAAGVLVGVGQLILGDATPKDWKVRHVAVVTQSSGIGFDFFGYPKGPNPKIVQAMPSGAEEIEIGPEHWTSEFIYVRPLYPLPYQGHEVARAAHGYVGTPYSFLDYLAITGVHLGIKNGPIRRYVTTSKHMICSQLADQAMCDADFHVFNDGRLSQDVTPSALYRKLISMPGAHVVPGAEIHWDYWRDNATLA